MAAAFRVLMNNGPSGAGANTVVTKDASVQNNDILLAGIYVEDDVAMTPPGGWTQIANLDHAAATYDLWVYWKRASGEGASWTWTHNSAWELGVVVAYSGCSTTGDPQDATATSNQGTSTTGTATGLTTVTDGAMIVAIYASFEGIAAQAAGPSGLTERYDSAEDIYWADGVQATHGASGNKVLGTALSASNHWGAVLVALAPDTGGSGLPPGLGPAVMMDPHQMMPTALQRYRHRTWHGLGGVLRDGVLCPSTPRSHARRRSGLYVPVARG